MANRYWVASFAGTWNDTFNWSTTSGGFGGASVPGASDDVFFDGNGIGNCTVDISPSIASIDIQSGYTGVFSDANFSFTVSGNVTLSGSNSSYGASTWTVGGNWDFNGGSLSGTNVTFNSGSSTFESFSRTYGTITVNSGVTLTTQNLGGSIQCDTLTANGTYTSSQTLRVRNFFNTGSSGEIAGTGKIRTNPQVSPNGIGTNLGLVSIADLEFNQNGVYPVSQVSGSISSANVAVIYTGSMTAYFRPTSNVTFSGNFTLSKPSGSGTTNFDAATNNPSITFGGDVVLSQTTGTVSWSAGTGTITLDSTAAQTVNFNGQTVEAIVVSDNSANAITLASNFTTPYVHDCANQIDENGYTVTTTGSDPSPCSTGSRYWVGLVDSDYENSGNWSTSSGGLGGASVPVGSNDVVFDSASSVNCTMSASRAAASIIWTGYSGSFDAVSNNFFCVGNFTRNNNVSVNLGSGTWTVGGTYLIGGHQNLTAYLATLVMTGTGVGYQPNSQSLGTLIIETGADVTGVHNQTSNWYISNLLDVRGTFSINDGRTCHISDGGELKVSGSLVYASGGTGVISFNKYAKITEYTGTIGVHLRFICDKASSAVYECLMPGTYGGPVTFFIGRFTNQELRLPAGSYVFNGNVSFAYQYGSPTLTVNNSTNNPSITFGGDVTLTDPYAFWSAGDGTIIFDNSGSQSVNFNGQTVEGIHVTDASTGSIVLASDFSTAWLRDCDSLIDLNGYTITNADSVDRCVYPYDPPTTIALDSAAAINVDQQLWLPMLEVSGTTTPDLSGNSNDGTLDAGLSHTVTTIGGAIEFPTDGSVDSNVSITSQPITASVWFYVTTLPTANGHSLKMIFTGQTSSARPTFYLYNPSGSKPIMRIYAGSGNLDGVTQINANEWTNATAVFDGANTELYVNGSLEVTGSVGTWGLQDGVRLGEAWNGAYDFPGRMQNVRVWSRALSSSEVSSLYSDPWIGSDYTGVVTPSNRFFSPAAFARLG